MELLVRQQITIALALFFGMVHCEPPLNNQYGPPGNFLGGGNNNNHHGGSAHGGGSGGGGGGAGIINSYGAPLADGHNGHNSDQDYIDSQPKSYEFGYAVKDTATGNDFGRSETSDGETVRGEYRVQLPDGRTQIVTYTADWRTGFHADVRYEGEATFPDQYNNNNNNNNDNKNNNGGFNSNGNNNYYNNNNGYNNNNFGQNNNGGYNNNNNQGFNNNYNRGNQGGYNYNGNYNNGGNNYQYTGSNSIDNYNGGGYTGSSGGSFATSGPSSTYGTPNFH